MDILERLKGRLILVNTPIGHVVWTDDDLAKEAAAEIERLRAEVAEYKNILSRE